MASPYVHGYAPREIQRLQDQAVTLAELFHSDTAYPPGATVLEAGCGVGSQTVTVSAKSPGARIVSLDISAVSLAAARTGGFPNVDFLQADIHQLPFDPATFDHVFVCFVLEHLADPVEVLRKLRTVLKPGGSITLIEGDHGSTFFYPDDIYARRTVDCLVELQARKGGDALIGRSLYPLLVEAGFSDVIVSPRFVYADASRPAWVEGFTKRTFASMIEGVREPALEAGMMSPADFDRGVAGLYRCAREDGVFCYTFFKARARRTT